MQAFFWPDNKDKKKKSKIKMSKNIVRPIWVTLVHH